MRTFVPDRFMLVRWRAWPEGRTFDLEVLSELFSGGDPLVAKDASGQYYLESSKIQGTDGRPDDDAVVALVTLMNGIARSAKQAFRPVNRGKYTAPDGTEHIVAKGSVSMASFGIKASDSAPSRGSTPTEPAPGLRYMSVADQDPNVARVLRILGKKDPLDWYDMYKILEIVEKSVGGEPQVRARGLASQADLDRLNITADRPSISGEAARHAFDRKGSIPSRDQGISLDQGIEVVRRMVSRWIESQSDN
jgi:hypothetical protein